MPKGRVNMKKNILPIVFAVLLLCTASPLRVEALSDVTGLDPTVTFGEQQGTQIKNLQNAGTQAVGQALLGSDTSCGLFHIDQCVAKVFQWIVNAVYYVLFLIVWVAASLLDFAVHQFIVEMGHYVDGSAAAGIKWAWQTIRDLTNIGIIGGLVAVAISTILQIEKYSAKTFLSRLIVAAILVNFSYFFAGAIIDASNYLSTKIYEDMITSVPGCTVDKCTLTSVFSNATNFSSVRQKLIDNSGEKGNSNVSGQIGAAAKGAASATQGAGQWGILWADIMSVVFELVVIFVFLSALALLVGRFVTLVFILVSSPIGIAGSAIPRVEEYAKKWWDALISQAFLAPVYFLLLDFSFRILAASRSDIMAGGQTLGQEFFGTALTFILACGFMLGALRIAKQMSAAVAHLGIEDIYKRAEQMTEWIPKDYSPYVRRAGAAATGFIGRETIGAAATKFEHLYDTKGAPLRASLIKALGGEHPEKTRTGRAALWADRLLRGRIGAVADKKFGATKNAEGKPEGGSSFKEEREKRLQQMRNLGIAVPTEEKINEARNAQAEVEDRKEESEEREERFNREDVSQAENDAEMANFRKNEGLDGGGTPPEPDGAGGTGGGAALPERREKAKSEDRVETPQQVTPIQADRGSGESQDVRNTPEAKELAYNMLARNAIRVELENGKTRMETPEETLRRLGASSADALVTIDLETGKLRAKTGRELLSDFGESALGSMRNARGEVVKETALEYERRLNDPNYRAETKLIPRKLDSK
jgi:hypothetical protein